MRNLRRRDLTGTTWDESMVEILQNFVANTYVNLSDFAPRPLLLDKFPAPCLLISFKIPPPYPYILFCDFTTFTLIMMLQLFHPHLVYSLLLGY